MGSAWGLVKGQAAPPPPHVALERHRLVSELGVAAQIGFHVLRKDGVDFVFADHPSFPRVGGPYADHLGV